MCDKAFHSDDVETVGFRFVTAILHELGCLLTKRLPQHAVGVIVLRLPVQMEGPNLALRVLNVIGVVGYGQISMVTLAPYVLRQLRLATIACTVKSFR